MRRAAVALAGSSCARLRNLASRSAGPSPGRSTAAAAVLPAGSWGPQTGVRLPAARVARLSFAPRARTRAQPAAPAVPAPYEPGTREYPARKKKEGWPSGESPLAAPAGLRRSAGLSPADRRTRGAADALVATLVIPGSSASPGASPGVPGQLGGGGRRAHELTPVYTANMAGRAFRPSYARRIAPQAPRWFHWVQSRSPRGASGRLLVLGDRLAKSSSPAEWVVRLQPGGGLRWARMGPRAAGWGPIGP